MKAEISNEPAIGVIGGSGVYQMDELIDPSVVEISTPYGMPSDCLVCGRIAGRRVIFLPRHGKGHRLMPHEINHRANIWAMRSLGVRWLITVSAVGSLREHIKPGSIVAPDQLIDRTGKATLHTFFGSGIAAHVGFADPYCTELRSLLVSAGEESESEFHSAATYLCMNGPAFSTRAEAAFHRSMGADLIGMTNAPEARLAREAEISMVSLALVTDYDCWKDDEKAVEVDAVVTNLKGCARAARSILLGLIPKVPLTPSSPSHRALDLAIMTDVDDWPEKTASDLAPILGRFRSAR